MAAGTHDLARSGPLAGLRVVEFAGIGPAPFCGMLLADLGAQVLRLDRTEPSSLGIPRPPQFDLLQRGKRSMRVDLKGGAGLALARSIVARADALIEGFRPRTMERLGLGPDVCLADNPKLIYGRMTGFGQEGPLAHAAGHDLNYLALTGALHAIGREGGPPTPPLNLVADYGGGGLMLAFGIVSAVLHARATGQGQVVDAAMVDGVGALMTPLHGLIAAGLHTGPRGTNLLDSGAPFYDVYRCADGEYVSLAPIEAKFQQVFRKKLAEAGVDALDLPAFDDQANWPRLRGRLVAIFETRTRAQWCEMLEGSDSCFASVLSPTEAPQHPHNAARRNFIEIAGVVQPAPAPRFSATTADVPEPPGQEGGEEWAAAWGVPRGELMACGYDLKT
ncbi:MAG: CaiB/BaiF CoA-transferase family protein [Polaromonas sp.]|uniref:CaiB/BaiF CoA transferase family protein n=1 Tax=Polaromonas sp. TaxID=1869339 RepID=UPI0027314EC4|nr:CaiB/BaiF CoA-transferase family protein [Polaromonas sp.]MDP2451371.1 CaiB/BaiF CoA-transferase family protein [Polaromonas sp.]MDP3826974.1 CaiB/BaiF CoA-transferase family protein [Polaromonas sp.]